MIEVMVLATTLRQALSSLAVALGMLVAWVGPVHAQRIVAFVNKDQEKSELDRQLLRAIGAALSEFQKATRPRPTGWGPNLRPRRLARAATEAEAQFGIDTLLWGRGAKVYTLLVVRSDGVVVLEQGVRLGARSSGKRITTLAQKAARAIQKRSKGAPTPPARSPEADGTGETDTAEPLTNLGRVDAAWQTQSDEPDTPASAPPSFSGSMADNKASFLVSLNLRLVARVGIGPLLTLSRLQPKESNETLEVDLPTAICIHFSLGLSIAAWVEIEARIERFAADVPNPRGDIPLSTISASGLSWELFVGVKRLLGPLRAEVGLGGTHLDAQPQEPVIYLPTFSTLTVHAGLAAGRLVSDGLGGRARLTAIPWGRHSEEPSATGDFSGLYGVHAELAAAYHWPDLVGSFGGVLVGASGKLDWHHLAFDGPANRAGPPNVELEDARESRYRLALIFFVGYMI